jgi:hypothetical protein
MGNVHHNTERGNAEYFLGSIEENHSQVKRSLGPDPSLEASQYETKMLATISRSLLIACKKGKVNIR